MHNSVPEESGAFEALSRSPIVCFSAFLKDLNRPMFLNNLNPSTEIVKTGVNFANISEANEEIPSELFNCTSFNPSKIMLNVAPVKEIAHDYDDFMTKILEDCYTSRNLSTQISTFNPIMTIPNPHLSTPMKANKSKPAAADTPTSSKVRLNVAGATDNVMEVLKKLIADESFVNPLCFDCIDDLAPMIKVIRSFSLSPPSLNDSELFENLKQTISGYLDDVNNYVNESSDTIDSNKAIYCMCLIGILNIGRLGNEDTLKDYTPFSTAIRYFELSKDSGSADLVMSALIESYVALLQKFRVHDSEISSYSTEIFNLCFDSPGPCTKAITVLALSQLFSKYPEYRAYIIDHSLMRATDSESIESQKLGGLIVLSCLQAMFQSDESTAASACTNFLNHCLNFCWKGDGNELPKASSIYFYFVDELQSVYSNHSWPSASHLLNHCALQMFLYVLKDDSAANNISKGSLMLKMRFLDVLSSISHTTSSPATSNDKRSFLFSLQQNSWFQRLLNPRAAFINLNACSQIGVYDQDAYAEFLLSGPLCKISERVVGLFVKLISCETTQLRSKAIKNLFALMNSSQLTKTNYDALKASIILKASDPSISVRDAALEFISKMIFTPLPHEDGPKELLECAISRIKDRGVSVRKRAVKIIGEVLQKGMTQEHDLKLSCIGGLISHVADEEDDVIVDAIFKTLKEQWIMKFLGADFTGLLPAAQRKIMSSFAEEVVNVIGFLQSDIKCLQDFLGRFLLDESIKRDFSAFFAGTVDVLLEGLLQNLEANDNSALKRSLESISLFSESNPQSLESHLGLLQSLLRSEDPEIALLSIKLLYGVISGASLAEMKKLQDLEKDLLGLIYRGSEVAVKLGIECLYHYVNNCSHEYGILSGLWQKFTDYLRARMSETEIQVSSVPHICRAILAAGVLCAQSAHHREKEFGMKDFHTGAQARCLLEFIQFYFKSPFFFIRSCTIQALGSLLMACPQISISTASLVRIVISSSLSEAEDDVCSIKMLSIFDQMIQVFNEGSADQTQTATMTFPDNNKSKNNILAMEGDESFFSALLQEHMNSISKCIILKDSLELRALALKICSSAAILGLVNPQLVIPYLAIGLNSENDHIQAYSRSSFERISLRFPSMVSKDLLLPSKLLYRQLNKKENKIVEGFLASSASNQVSRLSFFYSQIRGKNGRGGIEPIVGIFNYFEEIITSKHLDDKSSQFIGKDDLVDYVKFVMELIFTLLFSTSEELLWCLQRIQGIFSMSSDWIIEGQQADDELIKEKYFILKGLSYAVTFVLKSYPQILGMSIEEDSNSNCGNNNNTVKSVQRIQNVQFAFPKIEEEISYEGILNLISGQASIPNLLLQEPKNYGKRRQSNLKSIEDDEVDDDITGFLVDDEEISESESESEDDDFLISDEEAKLSSKKQTKSKKPIKSNNSKTKINSKKIKKASNSSKNKKK